MGTNDNILDEIRRYCDPYSLLVIKGRDLKRVHCPFKVQARYKLLGWKEDEIADVNKVMITKDLLMVFVIGDKGYPSYLFRIIL